MLSSLIQNCTENNIILIIKKYDVTWLCTQKMNKAIIKRILKTNDFIYSGNSWIYLIQIRKRNESITKVINKTCHHLIKNHKHFQTNFLNAYINKECCAYSVEAKEMNQDFLTDLNSHPCDTFCLFLKIYNLYTQWRKDIAF